MHDLSRNFVVRQFPAHEVLHLLFVEDGAIVGIKGDQAVIGGGDGYRASILGDQSTGILRTMVQADGFAFLPPDKGLFAKGELVDVHVLNRDFEMEEG